MTIEQFNSLREEEKNIFLFEATKMAERSDSFTKFELFRIDDFFVETKTSLLRLYRRTITTYTLRDLPLVYSGNLQQLWA
jgi:hypothetical protein